LQQCIPFFYWFKSNGEY